MCTDSEWDQIKSVSAQLGMSALAAHPTILIPYMEQILDFMEEHGDIACTLLGNGSYLLCFLSGTKIAQLDNILASFK